MTVLRLIESRSSNAEIAAAALENGKLELKRRVVPYILKFDRNGEPEFPYEMDTVIGRAEYEGMQNMRALALDGHKFIVWASPEGGRSNYNDGHRVVVAIVTSRHNGVTMECRGIVINDNSRDEFLESVRVIEEKGGVSMDEIRGVEDLREQAISVPVKNQDELWQMMEEAFGHSDIWDEIKSDNDKRLKHQVEEMVARYRGSPEAEIAKKRGDVYWGAGLENFLARSGFRIMSGNHGVTNNYLLQGLMTPFSMLFNMSSVVSSESLDPRLQYCEIHKVYFMKKKGQCPKCKG